MSRPSLVIGVPLVLLAIAGSTIFGMRLERAQKDTEGSLGRLRARIDAGERQTAQLKKELAAVQTVRESAETAAPQADEVEITQESITTAPQQPKSPDGPVVKNALRDIVVELHQCVLATRTLRCTFTVTNQSPAEKKFIIGVGGTYTRFEHAQGGSSVFDDLGNDFLSAGGGVANHALQNCDRPYQCEVEKTLTPGVRTAGWIRFDAVEPRASVVKLLRLKWTDGEAWVPMDFRGIPILREAS